jgi:RNA polymerase sigma-70 factor (ECF subfamily)
MPQAAHAALSNDLPENKGIGYFPMGLGETAADERSSGGSHNERILVLYDELRAPLLRYAMNRRAPLERAEEIVQEAFLALFRQERSSRPVHRPRAWLFRVVHNLALRELRTRRHEAPLFTSLLDMQPDARGLTDSQPAPDLMIAERQREARFDEALARLSDAERHSLDLRAEGLAYREIAEVLGASTSTVGDWVRRAIATLRRACEQ